MTRQTQELITLCEKLSEAKQAEVARFARSLIESDERNATADAANRWLASARGVAKPGVTTNQVMEQTRGET